METGQKVILSSWLIAVFGILCTIYLYAGRYVLLALPAMAIIAAHGLVTTVGKNRYLIGLAAIGFSWTLYNTHHQYYVDFTEHKAPDWEVDRIRGMHQFTDFLKANYSPKDTIVILGDPLNFTPSTFISHTAEDPFQFQVWTNHKDFPKGWKHVICLFSTTMTNNLDGKPVNDWTSNIPKLTYLWSYQYNGITLFHVFELKI